MKQLLLFLLFALTIVQTDAQQVIRLYGGKAPGSESWTWTEGESTSNSFQTRIIYNVVDPSLTVYLPDPALATGTAVIVAPGGGFHTLSIDREGIDMAKWLASKGVAAFVLKYRLVHSATNDPVKELLPLLGDLKKLDAINAPLIPLALQDGLAAVKYVRTHAKDFEVLPDHIGMAGFSAGATLTMSVVYNATSESRPDFIAPIYLYAPAIIGSSVPKEKTPVFIAAASDDDLGLASQSADVYKKWLAAGQPAELHVFEKGGHGFGMGRQKLTSDGWIDRFGEWMKQEGYLRKLHPSAYELQYTEEQIAAFMKANEDRMKNDWGYLGRYGEENKKILPPKAGENRVVFIGNSITQGWVSMDPDFFSRNSFIGRGISGQNSAQIMVRFHQDVVGLKPKAVVISAGTNDVAENAGPYVEDVTLGNIAMMAESAKANGIRVIIASVHPATEFSWRKSITGAADKIVQLNARLKNYAAANNFVYLDYHTAMKDGRNGMSKEIAADGVHPTMAGYKVMEPLAEKAVLEALK